MKKFTATLTVLLLVFSFASAVSAEAEPTGGVQKVDVNIEQVLTDPNYDLNSVDPALLEAFYAREVSIPDTYLKKALQSALNLDSASPVTVRGMFSLTGALNLSGLNISNLTGLEYAINISSLSLGNNSVLSLEPIKNLYNLKNLDYSNNSVKAIPGWIFSMRSLESVNGGSNGSTVFSSGPSASNTTIKSLYLENNQLTSIPDLSACEALEILSLSDNEFTQFPSSLLNLDKLQMLNFANNEIASVPDISVMTSITTINLDGNKLTEVPAGVDQLKALQQISLSANQITVIPDSVANSANLQILLLSMNGIENLPESLTKNTTLKVLDISLNDIDLVANADIINNLSKKLSTFYYKLQKPNFTLEIHKDKEAPVGKLVWYGIEDINDKTEGTLTITGFTIERIENPKVSTDSQGANTSGDTASTPAISVYVPIAEVDANVREYIDKDADPDKSYTYRVTANISGQYLNETEYTASGSETVSTEDLIKSEPGWLKSWWFYAIVGVVVAAVVAAAVIVLIKKNKK